VLIVSVSRIGGKLVRTLLDGHPEVNAFPYEHWNRRSKNEIPTHRMEAFARMSAEEQLATAGAPQAELKLLRVHEPSLVAEVMRAWRAATVGARVLPDMYEALARTYFPAIGRARDAVVVNHCGSLCRFTRDQVDGVYGKGTHVLTIRDPRAVFSSMQGLLSLKFTSDRLQKGVVSPSRLERHLKKLETIDAASGYLREFCEDYRSMVANYAACPDVIRLRFEDLVTSPEATMRSLAQRLGIRWETTLLEPTQLGGAHSPNSSFDRQGAAIHSGAAADWVGRIEPATRRYIEDTLATEMAALGYQRIDESGRTVLDAAPLLQ
jgi:hypothetical protein